jgi:hypothetical protein
MRGLRRHGLAAPGTVPASCNALLHVAQTLAIRGALLATFPLLVTIGKAARYTAIAALQEGIW